MKSMKIILSSNVMTRFPEATIHGVVLNNLTAVSSEKIDPWGKVCKESFFARGIKRELLAEYPSITEWRDVYKACKIKPSKYRSSIEQLARRMFQGKLPHLRIPVVNAYCYASIIHLVPMGGYDIRKIEGDISIRLGRKEDLFIPIGQEKNIPVTESMVVYTDEKKVICWMWNHRDSQETCFSQDTETGIFFADSATMVTRNDAEESINTLTTIVTEAGAKEICRISLDKDNASTNVILKSSQ